MQQFLWIQKLWFPFRSLLLKALEDFQIGAFVLIFLPQAKDITAMKDPSGWKCIAHGDGCKMYPVKLQGFGAGFSCTSVSGLNIGSESVASALAPHSKVKARSKRPYHLNGFLQALLRAPPT